MQDERSRERDRLIAKGVQPSELDDRLDRHFEGNGTLASEQERIARQTGRHTNQSDVVDEARRNLRMKPLDYGI